MEESSTGHVHVCGGHYCYLTFPEGVPPLPRRFSSHIRFIRHLLTQAVGAKQLLGEPVRVCEGLRQGAGAGHDLEVRELPSWISRLMSSQKVFWGSLTQPWCTWGAAQSDLGEVILQI